MCEWGLASCAGQCVPVPPDLCEIELTGILPLPADEGERIARVEALLEGLIRTQEKANDEARESRHRQANVQMVMDRRLEKVEAVLSPAGKPSLNDRVETIETVILGARVTWKTLAFIGSGVVALAGFIAWLVSVFGLPKILSPH